MPSIGRLLHETGEFTERVQKRYDDTALILDAVLEHGFASAQGRAAIRRMNRMHGAYPISHDDLRYVLCTFVVVPIRWIDELGWRRLSEHERVAAAHYYRELGRHMGIRDVPATHREFAEVLDAYERERFAFDPGGRAVADATLELFTTFRPNDRAPAALVRRFLRPHGRRAASGVPLPADLPARAAAGAGSGPGPQRGRPPDAAAGGTGVRADAPQRPQLPRRVRRRRARHLPARLPRAARTSR